MALFFDAAWFDARLTERGLSRSVMAVVAGLSEDELALVFKDQREVSAGQVSAFAELLGVPAAEVADRAGVATPGRRAASAPATSRLSAEPQLFAQDLAAAREFYTAGLGFNVAFSYGDPPFYLQVERGGARLNIRHVDGPVFAPGFGEGEPDVLAATLVTDDAQSLFHEFRDRGVTFHQPLRDEPWGARTFIVADPDGNLLCFAGRAAPPPGGG